MNPNGPRRGPFVWLLPLIVGVVLGGLFFGGSRGGERFDSRFDGPPWARSEAVPVAPAQPAQPVQPVQPAQPAPPQAAPQAPDPRFEARGQHFRGFDPRGGDIRREHGWGFFPFGGLRLLLPLLLIGTGAWLLFGRRGPRHMHSGPGGWGGPGGPGHWGGPGPQPAQQYGPGPYPAQPGVAPQQGQQAAPPPPAGPYSVPPTPPTPPSPTDPPSTGETRIL